MYGSKMGMIYRGGRVGGEWSSSQNKINNIIKVLSISWGLAVSRRVSGLASTKEVFLDS